MKLPILTDEDRKAHPYNSDSGVQAILLLNLLKDEEIMDLIKIKKGSLSYQEIEKAFSSSSDYWWVTKPIFLVSTAEMIAVRRGLVTENSLAEMRKALFAK